MTIPNSPFHLPRARRVEILTLMWFALRLRPPSLPPSSLPPSLPSPRSHFFCGHWHQNGVVSSEKYKVENVITSAVGLQIGQDKSGFRLVKVFEVGRKGGREGGKGRGWLLTLFFPCRMRLCTSTFALRRCRLRFRWTRRRRRRGDGDEKGKREGGREGGEGGTCVLKGKEMTGTSQGVAFVQMSSVYFVVVLAFAFLLAER